MRYFCIWNYTFMAIQKAKWLRNVIPLISNQIKLRFHLLLLLSNRKIWDILHSKSNQWFCVHKKIEKKIAKYFTLLCQRKQSNFAANIIFLSIHQNQNISINMFNIMNSLIKQKRYLFRFWAHALRFFCLLLNHNSTIELSI